MLSDAIWRARGISPCPCPNYRHVGAQVIHTVTIQGRVGGAAVAVGGAAVPGPGPGDGPGDGPAPAVICGTLPRADGMAGTAGATLGRGFAPPGADVPPLRGGGAHASGRGSREGRANEWGNACQRREVGSGFVFLDFGAGAWRYQAWRYLMSH